MHSMLPFDHGQRRLSRMPFKLHLKVPVVTAMVEPAGLKVLINA